MTEKQLIAKADKLVADLKEKNLTLGIAESCTGGWLSKIITDVSGASSIYNGGICSYSNKIKTKLLGVNPETLRLYGAVSEKTAAEMAEGARKALNSDIGVGITGIAGPTSDDTEKPVGLIYIAVSDGNKTLVEELRNNFTDEIRLNNRLSAIETALTLLGGLNEKK
ncbi:MAG: CinA family protein [Clostridia bacterium]|nr:CinA family protein [Clostridia bacterium]